jgi:deazaflavin-dependent oxidoreductase (nitroreductase family)
MHEPGLLLDDDLRAASVCMLTTIGRSTGEPREIEIWFAAVDDQVFLLSGGREGAHWVRNLQSDPRVQVRIRGRTFEGRAAVIEGTVEDPVARDALGAKYGRDGLRDWLRESLPVAITLERDVTER